MFKISKAPELPKFSGAEPVPREEGSFEQWFFQVKGSQSQHTTDAIRSGIVNSVRGEARDLVAYVGFDAPLETILNRLEQRLCKTKSTDRLQHDFFELGQEKSEGVQQYAGRLENQYKKLKAAFPDRYRDAQLMERLFFGMIPGLWNATRYLYKKMGMTYEQLLDAAKEAELELTESRGIAAQMKAVGMAEKSDAAKLQELNNRIDTLMATIKANAVKPKSASAPNSPLKKRNENGNNPLKSKGPETTSHGPFRGGKKPLQCYKCGGWGHGWRECPSPGKHRLEEVEGGRTSSSRKGGPNKLILKQGSISKFYNPDPLVRLIGEPNENFANVEGIKTKVLLDSGAQLSSITNKKAKELGLEIKHLQTILDLEATGGGEVPYKGYVELNLDIPGVAKV